MLLEHGRCVGELEQALGFLVVGRDLEDSDEDGHELRAELRLLQAAQEADLCNSPFSIRVSFSATPGNVSRYPDSDLRTVPNVTRARCPVFV